MKFYVGDKMSGMYIKGQIVKEYRDNGNVISLNKVRHILREKEEDSDFVWNIESKLDKKIRLRECKDGWYIYLPEPNVKIEINQKPLIGDVCVFETEVFERLVNAIIDGFQYLANEERTLQSQNEAFLSKLQERIEKDVVLPTVPCIVKARKSGPKAVRVDRPARFHRWVHSTKGVEQELALVNFPDGHTEYIQPTNIIFPEEVE